jgi:hypothetical protein
MLASNVDVITFLYNYQIVAPLFDALIVFLYYILLENLTFGGSFATKKGALKKLG